MKTTFKQQKRNQTTLSKAEEIFVERMARILIEQIKNENGAENEKQVKHPIKIME